MTLLTSLLTSAALAVPADTGAGASPPNDDPRGPAESDDRALADIDAAEASPDDVAGALADLQGNVTAQLEQLELAEAAVRQAESELADIQAVVDDTEMRIDELQARSDAVVVEAFVNPPSQGGVDVFGGTMEEATIRQGILDLYANDSARVLAELDEQQAALEEQQETLDARLADADEARADAQAALADLEAAVSAQTRFVLDVRQRLATGDLAATDDPRILERQAQLQAAIDEAEEAAEFAEAMRRLEEERRRRELAGIWECPVQGGNLNFVDTWGAARSGGRSHQGTDMMADYGTPTVAPVSGTVEHRENSLGGLVWYVYGDDGNTYYGAHLSGYENVGAGRVERGTVIGYVGTSGNARGTPPHLHFEYQPGGGSSVNPYDRLIEAC